MEEEFYNLELDELVLPATVPSGESLLAEAPHFFIFQSISFVTRSR